MAELSLRLYRLRRDGPRRMLPVQVHGVRRVRELPPEDAPLPEVLRRGHAGLAVRYREALLARAQTQPPVTRLAELKRKATCPAELLHPSWPPCRLLERRKEQEKSSAAIVSSVCVRAVCLCMKMITKKRGERGVRYSAGRGGRRHEVEDELRAADSPRFRTSRRLSSSSTSIWPNR